MQFIEKNSFNVRSAIYCLKKDGSEDFEPLDALIVDECDRTLIERVARLENQQKEAKQIGIVYGARHMRSAMRFLIKRLNYRIAKAEWFTVFEL